VVWKAVALTLARKAGIAVPRWYNAPPRGTMPNLTGVIRALDPALKLALLSLYKSQRRAKVYRPPGESSLPRPRNVRKKFPMPKDRTQKPTANIATESHPNLTEEIRRRVHNLYEERDREDGHDMEDWLRAEAEITGIGVRTVAA
jgi:hypothetical protein